MRKGMFVAAVGVLVLGGCATPYQKLGFRGGYTDTKLQEGVYRIGFSGNSVTETSRSADFAMLRAAEVGLENGYGYFIVANSEKELQTVIYSSPASGVSAGVGYVTGPGVYTATGYSFSGHTDISQMPQNMLLVQYFKEKPANARSLVFDAAQVAGNIRAEYGLRPKEVTAVKKQVS